MTARPAGDAPAAASARPARSTDWRRLLLVYALTSAVEGLGVSQIYAFVPAHLATMGVPDAERVRFIGLFGSLLFVLGAPLVPLWGVWADKYSRKVVIIRSSVVLGIVLVGVGLSREPWQLGASMLFIGLQLGNTGVMLAGLREVVPRERLGRALAIFGAGSPVGFALGPAIGGLIVDGFGLPIGAIYLVSAVLTAGVVLLLAVASDEIRPAVVPTGPVLRLAYGALRGVLTDRSVLAIFGIYAVVFLANQMTRPYLPLLVEGVVGRGAGLASAIAVVTGLAALGGALLSPVGGAVGDRFGFRPVLVGSLAIGGAALLAMPLAGSVPGLAAGALTLAAMFGVASAMVFGLLATEVPADRRSATLNLVYLPLYAAGIVGPVTGALTAAAVGLEGPFLVGAATFAAAAAVLGLGVGISRRSRPSSPA